MAITNIDITKLTEALRQTVREEVRTILTEEFANKIAERAVNFAWGEAAANKLQRRMNTMLVPAVQKAIRRVKFNVSLEHLQE